MRVFYHLLVNTIVSSVTNFTVWFAIVFFAYLQTQSVLVTSAISGFYLIATALSGFWFGSLVDRFKKKNVILISSGLSLVSFVVGFLVYMTAPLGAFTEITSPSLWALIFVLMLGVIVGNIRGIALPTIITFLVPEKGRDKANGLASTAAGIGFLVTSVISGILVGSSGMYLILVLAMVLTALVMIDLWFIPLEEPKAVHTQPNQNKVDIKGTLKVITAIPGLLALILFTTLNNLLGGVFMSLMDAYGLSMVSVQTWGFIWGFLSTGFILGGLIIARVGLGKNPLKTLFLANIVIWTVGSLFTIQPSIILLIVGCYIYLTASPFIEASEHTIIQKLVPSNRQGRVFGFAQSVELAAAPLTALMIGPIAEFVVIPFMTTGAGVELIGSWYGTGYARGIALVFTITGLLGLILTLLAFSSKYYRQLSAQYLKR